MQATGLGHEDDGSWEADKRGLAKKTPAARDRTTTMAVKMAVMAGKAKAANDISHKCCKIVKVLKLKKI